MTDTDKTKDGALSLDNARSLYENGQIVKAVSMLIGVIKNDRTDHTAYDFLGDIYAEQGQKIPAVENYAQAVAYDPDNIAYQQKLVDSVGSTKFKKINPNLKGVLQVCLENDAIDLRHFGRGWLSINERNKGFSSFYKLAKSKKYLIFKKAMDAKVSCDPLIDSFFLTGLGQFIVPESLFEQWLIYLRRYLLEQVSSDNEIFSDPDFMAYITCTLSRYCFMTDYVFPVSDEEAPLIKTLREAILSTDQPDLVQLACLGCYEPLYQLEHAQSYAEQLEGGDDVSQILKSQIEDYYKLQAIKAGIKTLSDIKDPVSMNVQEQYEVFPYPRWRVVSGSHYHKEIEGPLQGDAPDILIAGCGTGQEAIHMAYVFPDAKITAIDLSRSSLAYAISKAEEFDVKNIEFFHCDILDVSKLGKHFDYITSSGVLHHMDDPVKGWAALDSVLKEKGLMRIALYSAHARWAINKARDVIKKHDIGFDAESIISFRRDIQNYLKLKEIRYIENFYDYYFLPECRDLLFHVQEHQFDLNKINDILDQFELEFLQFHLSGAEIDRYKRQNKEDVDARDLKRWAAWEENNADLFRAMYVFWCRKKG